MMGNLSRDGLDTFEPSEQNLLSSQDLVSWGTHLLWVPFAAWSKWTDKEFGIRQTPALPVGRRASYLTFLRLSFSICRTALCVPQDLLGRRGAILLQILRAPCVGQCVRMKSEIFEEFQNNRCILETIIIDN